MLMVSPVYQLKLSSFFQAVATAAFHEKKPPSQGSNFLPSTCYSHGLHSPLRTGMIELSVCISHEMMHVKLHV